MARKSIVRTSAPLYPEHPESEHNWRMERARQIMAEQGLDVLLLSRNPTVFYASGSRFVFVGKDAPTATAPQSTFIITPETDIYCQRFGPFDTDGVALHTAWSEAIEAYDSELELPSILSDYGVEKGMRIGVEWEQGLPTGIHPLKFIELKKQVEEKLGAEFVEGTPAVWKIMGVKSDLEVERMQVAVDAASRAMVRLFDYIEIGMNELDVARQVRTYMLEEGAESAEHAQVMAQGANGIRLGSCNALDRPIESGWVTMDIGCKYKSYKSDINRGVFLGREPTPIERDLYECRVGISELLDSIIKPGVYIDDVLAQIKDYAEARNCTIPERGGKLVAGHSLGLEAYLHPAFAPTSIQMEFANEDGKMLFEKGMMFTYEMPLRIAGSEASFNIEDDVVVTDTGVKNMSAAVSREIRVKM